MEIKTVIIVNDFGFVNGGAGKIAISTALGLAENGYRVIFFCAVGPVGKELIHPNIQVICTNQLDILHDSNKIRAIKQGLWNIKAKKIFKEILNFNKPENTVIHFHAWIKALSPSILSLKQLRQYKICITLHDFFLYCPNGGLYIYPKKKICNYEPMSCKCIFCNCDSRSYFQKVWRVIRQFVQNRQLKKLTSTTFISISELSESLLNTKFGLIPYSVVRNNNPIDAPLAINESEPKNLYLFMARLSSEKGLDLFCQAIDECNVKGCVIGDGYLKDFYKSKYSKIIFPGWLSGVEKMQYIQKTKFFVFPSKLYETFGLSVAEMLSYGVPCIVSNTSAAKELIEDGKSGFIFQNGNIDSLKETIKKAEQADWLFMHNYIKKNFHVNSYSMHSHINRLVNIYSKSKS